MQSNWNPIDGTSTMKNMICLYRDFLGPCLETIFLHQAKLRSDSCLVRIWTQQRDLMCRQSRLSTVILRLSFLVIESVCHFTQMPGCRNLRRHLTSPPLSVFAALAVWQMHGLRTKCADVIGGTFPSCMLS